MTVPPGLFEPGGRTGLAQQRTNGTIPIDWLEAHPAVRRWMGRSVRNNVGAAEIIDLAIELDDGFEGIIQQMVLTDKALSNGVNTGTAWRLYYDGVPAYETRWQANAVLDQGGRFDYLFAGDGVGNSWGRINHWIPPGARVEVGINNNGGTSDPMGWYCWGMYWPLSVRDEWMARGWRGR